MSCAVCTCEVGLGGQLCLYAYVWLYLRVFFKTFMRTIYSLYARVCVHTGGQGGGLAVPPRW